MFEPHPNGISTNGVTAWLDVVQVEESAASAVLPVLAFRGLGMLLRRSPRLEYAVVVSRLGNGEVARRPVSRSRRRADDCRQRVVQRLRAIGDRDASDAECKAALDAECQHDQSWTERARRWWQAGPPIYKGEQ